MRDVWRRNCTATIAFGLPAHRMMRIRSGQHMTQQVSSVLRRRVSCALAIAGVLVLSSSFSAARAQSLGYSPPERSVFPQAEVSGEAAFQDEDSLLPERLRRQIVHFDTSEAPGTIVIDTGNTYLYYVLGGGRAIRYGVGVGRQGFTWAGVQTVSRKAEWPDWYPPSEMIARQPYLPRFVAGGPGNPLGARAMYLGASEYRIHGTNDPTTIGKFVSSGCIRLTNEDVTDLFSRVSVGTRVVVLPKNAPLPPRNVAMRPAGPLSSSSARQAKNVPVSDVN